MARLPDPEYLPADDSIPVQSKEAGLDLCTFYVVRHGETEWNVRGVVQGYDHDSPLTLRGKEQARALARELCRVPFAAAFSSDSGRAVATLDILLRGRSVPVHYEAGLRERRFGALEGQPVQVMVGTRECMGRMDDRYRFHYKSAPDIESDAELADRMLGFLHVVAPKYIGKSVLVVTHGGMMSALLLQTEAMTYSRLQECTLRNTAWLTLQSNGTIPLILEVHGLVPRGPRLTEDQPGIA